MRKKRDWTVMIYMIGDNNLSIDMVYALEELQKKVIKNHRDNINLFVYYENNSPEIPALYCDFSDYDDPIYKYSTDISEKFTDSQEYSVQNSQAINPLLDFVDWCVNKVEYQTDNGFMKGRYADNYALIFSGHTMGFLSMGLLKEETTNISMTMPSLQKGLEKINTEILGKKLSLLGFDSCVMSMFEVGNQFGGVAETMIASEGSIPNAGWSYSEILESLINNESKNDIKKIASDVVKKYVTKQSGYSIGGVSVDMSAWDLSKIEILNNKIEKLSENLLSCFNDESSVIYSQLRRIILQAHFNCQTYMYDQNIDLGDFCQLLINEIDLLKLEKENCLHKSFVKLYTSILSVLKTIDECIILSGHSGGEYQYSTGISMFFPWSLSAYQVSMNDYQQLRFVNETEAGSLWNQFLQKYLSEVSLRKAVEVDKICYLTEPYNNFPNPQLM